jgi:hypothetical protein
VDWFSKLDPLSRACAYVGMFGLIVIAIWILCDPQARALAGW